MSLEKINIERAKKEVTFPMWPGEFGWEIMRWIPHLRGLRNDPTLRGYRFIAHARPDVWRLYADFCDVVIKRDNPGRGLDYWKQYHATPEMVFERYGDPKQPFGDYDVVIHARGIRRKDSINYTRWDEVIRGILHNRPDAQIATVGTIEDHYIAEGADLRGVRIAELCNTLASAKVVVGCSSGVMHLAALCTRGRLVAWGDARTYFGETLQQRYETTWNPLNVSVDWITADDWQPEPAEIVSRTVEAIDG